MVYLLLEYLHTDCNSPNTLVSHKLREKRVILINPRSEDTFQIQYTSIWPEVDVSGYVLVCWGKAIYQRLFVLRINIPKLPIIVSLIWEWVINGSLRCKYHSVLVQRVSSQLSATQIANVWKLISFQTRLNYRLIEFSLLAAELNPFDSTLFWHKTM